MCRSARAPESRASKSRLIGVVASPDGNNLCRSEISGRSRKPPSLGKRLAEQLLERGAGELLASI